MIELFRKVLLWLALLWIAASTVSCCFGTAANTTATALTDPVVEVGSPAHPSSFGFD